MMKKDEFDIIIIGCGSGGLSVGLFMAKAGFEVLMVSKTDHDIGGDCLNDGCVPSKAFIHVAKILHNASEAKHFGLELNGKADIKKVINYINEKQENIRIHENAEWLSQQGIRVVLGEASFFGKNEIVVNGQKYLGKKIVIATGSRPKKLKVPGTQNVKYFDNENIFHLDPLPQNLLVIGGGPIGIEIAQAISRMGSKVTVVHTRNNILEHDDPSVTEILQQQLEKEGIKFILNASVDHFISKGDAIVKLKNGNEKKVTFDAVFVAIGRDLNIENLQCEKGGIFLKDNKIIANKFLQTTNKNVFVCGDVAGDLKFSHAAEFHARILLNNFFSPFNKKLNDDHMSWVTFTDPEVATFGLSGKELSKRKIKYEKLEQSFEEDDRAVVDNYQYGKVILFIGKKDFLKGRTILGGTMIAPGAGEIVQELILANKENLSLNAVFNKIYPYPVASRINQKVIVGYKSRALTSTVKKLLRFAYKIFS